MDGGEVGGADRREEIGYTSLRKEEKAGGMKSLEPKMNLGVCISVALLTGPHKLST